MEIITTHFKSNFFIDENLVGKNFCFLDIETTGLNRSRDIVYLVGILYLDNDTNNWILNQIFANGIEKERNLLLATMEVLSKFDKIINYNGNSFDIPFINQRLKIHSIHDLISKENSLDIYSIIRANKNILNIENLKLKTIEKYLGIQREDIYTGKDCIKFYKDYLLNGDQNLKDNILKHNYDDLYYLIEVIEILNIIDDKKTFKIPYEDQYMKFIIDTIKLSKDYLIINGTTLGKPISKIMHYGKNYTVLIGDNSQFEISMEIKQGLIRPTETCFFINKKDYNILHDFIGKPHYNLPEDIIIIQMKKKYIMENIKKILIAIIINILN